MSTATPLPEVYQQSMQGDGPQHAVARRGQQRLENLSAAVIVQRRSSQARLEQGEPSAFLHACPQLVEGMMAIENRQAQRLHATTIREDMRREGGQQVSMRPVDPSAYQLGQELLATVGRCAPLDPTRCVERALRYLDTWYTQTFPGR